MILRGIISESDYTALGARHERAVLPSAGGGGRFAPLMSAKHRSEMRRLEPSKEPEGCRERGARSGDRGG
jgi:hypothetical protein